MIKPLGDHVVILPAALKEKVGSIIVPEQAQNKPVWGTVEAVGVEADELVRGDKVIYGKYSGTEIEHEGEKYVLMREDDVLGVLQDGPF